MWCRYYLAHVESRGCAKGCWTSACDWSLDQLCGNGSSIPTQPRQYHEIKPQSLDRTNEMLQISVAGLKRATLLPMRNRPWLCTSASLTLGYSCARSFKSGAAGLLTSPPCNLFFISSTGSLLTIMLLLSLPTSL